MLCTRVASAEPHHSIPEMQALWTTRFDCLKCYQGCEIYSHVPFLTLIAAIPSFPPYFFCFSLFFFFFIFVSFFSSLFHFFAFYLVRLPDLAKEASFKHHRKPSTSKTDKTIIFHYIPVAQGYQVLQQLRSLWLWRSQKQEKSLFPSVLFASLYSCALSPQSNWDRFHQQNQ